MPEAEAPSDPLEVEVKQLSELLNQVKDEQSYIVIRERTHRNTAESTNGRVKWWSIFQLGVLLGEGIFQVWWLKRFFEVSTPVYSQWRGREWNLWGSQCNGIANLRPGQTRGLKAPLWVRNCTILRWDVRQVHFAQATSSTDLVDICL